MGFCGGPSKGYPANLVQGSHGGRSENKLLEVNRSVYGLQEEYAGPYQGLGHGPHCAPHSARRWKLVEPDLARYMRVSQN